MGKGDLGDALNSGLDIDDLFAAAKGDAIVVEAAASKQADLGIATLEKAIGHLQQLSSDQPEWSEILDKLMGPTALLAIGFAMQTRARHVAGPMHKLGELESKAFVSALQRAAKASVPVDGIAVASPIAALVRPLDEAMNADSGKIGELRRLECPRGFFLDAGGVSRPSAAAGQSTIVTHSPILIARQEVDAEARENRWTVAFVEPGSGQWAWTSIPREDGQDSRKLTGALARRGAPVNSRNAADVVEFLASFERHNRGRIPVDHTTRHLGWQSDRSFLPGMSTLKLSVPDGDAELVKGWGESSGSLEGWYRALRDYVIPYPIPMIALYASIAAPLLAYLDQPGFVVDISGETSGGKTTSLRVAASVWGPFDRVVKQWGTASAAGPQAYAALLGNCPLILDDTKAMDSKKQREVVASLLYTIPSGEETHRVGADGSSKMRRRWRLPMITTGEAPITSFSNAAGSRARTLLLRGKPFEESGDQRVQELVEAIGDHYGHFASLFLRELSSRPKSDLTKRLRELVRHYEKQTSSNGQSGVASRIAGYVALLRLAAEIAHQIGLPGKPDAATALMLKALDQSASQADRPADALRRLWTWVHTHGEQIEGIGADQDHPHSQGTVGVLRPGYLAIEPPVLTRLLLEDNFDPQTVLASWEQRGWLKLEPRRGMNARVTLRGASVTMIVIKLDEKTKPVLDLDTVGVEAVASGPGPDEPPPWDEPDPGWRDAEEVE